MGWVHLVETRGIISADGYHNLPASDKLRVLLADLRIPTAIPAHQTHLQQFASAFNHVDGPAAVVDMRNSIVHPNVKRRTRLLTAGTMAKFEAAELVRQYVEFVLLAQLGYTGYVKDRTARTSGRAAAMPVPWA
jgi:hypothetical protein